MRSMYFQDIGRLVSEDQHSLKYLWRKRGEPVCPSCTSPDFYYLKRSRVRCKRCGKDHYPLKGTRFTELRISPSQWVSLIKLFELSVSARKTSKETALNYKTTLKAYDLLMRVLVENLAEHDDPLRGELEADESYFGGK